MITNFIEKVLTGEALTFTEAEEVMGLIMDGKSNNSQIAALLTAVKMKGETPEELAGFAMAMRNAAEKVNIEEVSLIDVCGTGGDSSGTFNISTAVSFIVAAAGYKVAKHGNRSITSNSGSADVLTELGISIELTPELAKKAIEEVGISFLFAPLFHPAMKYAMPVRKELGFKTIFNILGPLTNPAGTKKQLIGTFDNRTAELMCEASKFLGMDSATFVCTSNMYDEITLTGDSLLIEYDSKQGIRKSIIDNETFEYPMLKWNDLQGGSPVTNAKIIRNIFSTEKVTPQLQVVCANSAVALKTAGYSTDLIECKNKAEEVVLTGEAKNKLNDLKKFCESL